MTATAVTRFRGVTCRSDSTVWWFALRAPQDLLHRFDGKPWAVRCFLGTSDLRQVNDRARDLQADWAERFAAMLLEGGARPAERITPDMREGLAQHMAATLLEGR